MLLEPSTTREELVVACKARFQAGGSVEQLIEFLRSSGCSKIDTIAVIASACGVGLGDAKEAVHFSPAWDDTRAEDERFQKLVVNTVLAGLKTH